MNGIFPLLMAFMFLIGSIVGSAPTAEAPAKPEFRQVAMDEAIAMMETTQDYILLDVRREDEYKEGHIPGAILIPNETIETDPPELLPDMDQLIFVYCRSGNRSKKAAQKLADMGYTNIVEFGGIMDWPGEIVTE